MSILDAESDRYFFYGFFRFVITLYYQRWPTSFLSIRHGLKGVNIHYLGARLGKDIKEIRCQIFFFTFCIMGAKLQQGIPIKFLLHLILSH